MAQVSGRLLLLNGWSVPVAVGTNAQEMAQQQEQSRFDGGQTRNRRALPRDWSFATTPLDVDKAETLANLLSGVGHVLKSDTRRFRASSIKDLVSTIFPFFLAYANAFDVGLKYNVCGLSSDKLPTFAVMVKLSRSRLGSSLRFAH